MAGAEVGLCAGEAAADGGLARVEHAGDGGDVPRERVAEQEERARLVGEAVEELGERRPGARVEGGSGEAVGEGCVAAVAADGDKENRT